VVKSLKKNIPKVGGSRDLQTLSMKQKNNHISKNSPPIGRAFSVLLETTHVALWVVW